MIYGQQTAADHVGLCCEEGREDKTRAVAKHDLIAKLDRLQVLCFTGRHRHVDLLLTAENVDRRRLADVGVAHHAHDNTAALCSISM